VDPAWAWASYEPDAERPWSKRWAAHLYRRAAFGATWQELEAAIEKGPRDTVTRLIQPDGDVAEYNQTVDAYASRAARSGNIEGLRAWWLRRMIETPHPLLEKMTLFWHSHFGVSNVRVASPQLISEHLSMLRANALEDYPSLLTRVTEDPAVFLALDAESNRRSLPNKSLARQFLETLSMGPGKYGEEDVRETARAFTGWFVLRGTLRFFPREHDDGPKNVLGERGNWTPKDIIRILLERPATPRLLVRKLYRWLISEVDEPSDELLEPLVTPFAKNYDLRKLISTILQSNIFFSPVAYRQRVKSPVDLAVGLIRSLHGTVPTLPLGKDLAELGQSLGEPPTPRGWTGGRDWMNSATLVARQNLVRSMLAPQGPYKGKLDPLTALPDSSNQTPEAARRFFAELLVQDDMSEASRQAIERGSSATVVNSSWARNTVSDFTSLPEFQLS
jgi:uncharacterized protein (DUF1800 family)